jgi:hypothetical protein
VAVRPGGASSSCDVAASDDDAASVAGSSPDTGWTGASASDGSADRSPYNAWEISPGDAFDERFWGGAARPEFRPECDDAPRAEDDDDVPAVRGRKGRGAGAAGCDASPDASDRLAGDVCPEASSSDDEKAGVSWSRLSASRTAPRRKP